MGLKFHLAIHPSTKLPNQKDRFGIKGKCSQLIIKMAKLKVLSVELLILKKMLFILTRVSGRYAPLKI